MYKKIFGTILHANDGSEYAVHAFAFALRIEKKNGGELHMVSVKEINYMREFIEGVRQQKGVAARRLRTVLQRARSMAAKDNLKLHCHLIVGHLVRVIVALARDLKVELLVIGIRGHSALYERVRQSSESDHAARSMSCIWSQKRRIASGLIPWSVLGFLNPQRPLPVDNSDDSSLQREPT
jgi:nucleotide-binding universal stress UspA family protein